MWITNHVSGEINPVVYVQLKPQTSTRASYGCWFFNILSAYKLQCCKNVYYGSTGIGVTSGNTGWLYR